MPAGSVGAGPPLGEVVFRLIAAIVFGGGVAAIYRWSHGREEGSSKTLVTTLVLLSALIATVSIVIADSVARAFSLVGALSIVRFRTVVDDTRDTAFVIFAVIVGMAAGAGLVLVPVVALPLIGGVAIWLSRSASPGPSAEGAACKLVVRLGLGRDPDEFLGTALSKFAETIALTGTSTARQGSAIEVTYQIRLRPECSMIALLNELNRVDGVMNVELNRTGAD
jgi:hypothetical protein